MRGSVVDVFPIHFSLPVRFDFSNETLENIHTFDPATGKRLEYLGRPAAVGLANFLA